MLQKIHCAMLGYLMIRLAGKEEMVSRKELEEWFAEEDSHPKSVGRVLADLRNLGLIHYESDRRGRAIRVRLAAPDQLVLGLNLESESRHGIPETIKQPESRLESRKSVNRPPKPPHDSSRRDSLSGGTPPCVPPHEEKSLASAHAREGDGRRVDMAAALEELRRRRSSVCGKARLPEQEIQLAAEVLAGGGTLSGLDEALALYRTRLEERGAPPGERGWRWALQVWKRDLEARRAFLAGHVPSPPPVTSPVPAPAIRIAARLTPEQAAAEFDRRQRARGYAPIDEVRNGGRA